MQGACSVHREGMCKFISVYVNPKLRNMRMEAYAVVVPYPLQFPNINNA